jgi:diguanylate cyclase (GGDEF)-like protein/PAS domain S-box-containing protein
MAGRYSNERLGGEGDGFVSDTTMPAKPRRGPILALALGGGVLIAAIAIATALAVSASRDRAIGAAKRELENNAHLLARHYDQVLGDFAAVQKAVAAEIELEKIGAPDAFDRMMSTAAIHRMLASKVMGAARELVGVNLWNVDGQLLNASQEWPVAKRSVAQRKYFNALKSGTADGPLVVELVTSQFVDGRALVFAQKITSPNGDFLGLITRSLAPKGLESFFASVALGPDAAISLVHTDGTLIARHPQADHLVGKNITAQAQFERLRGAATSAVWTSGPVDGAPRFAAPAQLKAFPLSVVVSTTVDAALREWREQTKLLVIVAGLSVLVISLTLFLIIRQLRRQYEASRQRLMLQKQRLDTAVNNMKHALLLFDAQNRLVLCNDRYIEMFGVSSEVVKPGCTLRQLIQHRKDVGTFHGDVEQHCNGIIDRLREGKATRSAINESDGRIVELVLHPLPDGGWVATLEDITDRRRSEERIAHMAHYDPLTELPNRLLFRERLAQALQQIKQGTQIAVFYIDIDGFKTVNDSLGHSIGDELLKGIATRLSACIGDKGLVARLGGDEFAIIQTDVKASSEVTDLVERIYQTIREPYDCMGHQLMTDASIGIALAWGADNNLEQLVKNADLAMYDAKAGGRRTHRFFDPSLEARAKSRHLLELDLRQAVAEQGFEIHYQPIVDLGSNEIAGCEALLRWHHPERGFVSPAEFIPIAEDIGVIDEIGEWVLNAACAEAASWPSAIHIAVNVSPTQFRSRTLALKVAAALARAGLSPERLELEVTEAVLIRDHEAASETLGQLRALGVSIALDDFGTGYSSLSYLHRFHFDKIKIDRSFICELSEVKSRSILRAALAIAAAQNVVTTAEGVETEEQRQVLLDLGCTQMQGWLFSPARPADEIKGLLRGSARRVAASA